MPIPVYTRAKGFHVIRYPVHQVFAVSFLYRSAHDIFIEFRSDYTPTFILCVCEKQRLARDFVNLAHLN